MAAAARTLDFGRPVALMLLAVLQFVLDEQDPYGAGSPAGRRAAARQLPGDLAPDRRLQPQQGRVDGVYNERSAEQAVVRDKAETARFFDGLDLLDPAWSPSPSGGRTPS